MSNLTRLLLRSWDMREMHTCIAGVPEIHLCKPGDISPTCTDGLYLHGIHQQAKAEWLISMYVCWQYENKTDFPNQEQWETMIKKSFG
jgi:hypothetical protein